MANILKLMKIREYMERIGKLECEDVKLLNFTMPAHFSKVCKLRAIRWLSRILVQTIEVN